MSCGPSTFLRTNRRPTPKHARFGFEPVASRGSTTGDSCPDSSTSPRSQLEYSMIVTERPCNALLAFTSRYISSGICIVAFMALISYSPYCRNAVLPYITSPTAALSAGDLFPAPQPQFTVYPQPSSGRRRSPFPLTNDAGLPCIHVASRQGLDSAFELPGRCALPGNHRVRADPPRRFRDAAFLF